MQFKDISEKILKFFDTKKARSVDQVWERSKDGWKWVLSLNNFFWGTSMVIHTKIILKTDNDKNIKTNWSYLFDFNCNYHHKEFTDGDNLLEQIKDIFVNNRFGHNIKSMSKQMRTPVIDLNNLMGEEGQQLSFYEFYYEPQKDLVPCKNKSFRFIANIEDIRDLEYLLKWDAQWYLDIRWQNRFKQVRFDNIDDFSKQVVEATLMMIDQKA